MSSPIVERGPKVRVVASPSTWIEGEALRQLDVAAGLEGMVEVVGMPDLHPGKGGPVGAAFLSSGVIRPSLVGSDIGCGMALWATDLPAKRLKVEKAAGRLQGLDEPWEGDVGEWLRDRGVASTSFDDALGTVGHGNHFAELQVVHEVLDPVAFDALGLDRANVVLLVHTGSRGLGEHVLREHSSRFGAVGIVAGEDGSLDYMRRHDHAVAWARANRDLVAHRVGERLGIGMTKALDVCHNDVREVEVDGCRCHLHRKGAAPSDRGPVVIPGSRGDVSVIVRPVPGRRDALWSLAHGAGRKLARHEAKGKLEGRLRRTELDRNRFGGVVVCGDDRLIWEEAPEAYKDIASVVGDLTDAGLVEVVAVLRPMVTFKCSDDKGGESRREKDARLRERKDARRHRERERS